jgi:hypothetical protein
MNDMIWISWIMGAFSSVLLILILHMKKTDPVFGCDKYKRKGCKMVSGRDCGFPYCVTLEKFHTCDKQPH